MKSEGLHWQRHLGEPQSSGAQGAPRLRKLRAGGGGWKLVLYLEEQGPSWTDLCALG